jgi:ribosomal protein L37AE/L43A
VLKARSAWNEGGTTPAPDGHMRDRLRGNRRRRLFLGSIAKARRTTRPDHEHREDHPDRDDCRYHDHRFVLVRLFMCIDCEHDRSGGCYRPVFLAAERLET